LVEKPMENYLHSIKEAETSNEDFQRRLIEKWC
jgi:hypothetical protein